MSKLGAMERTGATMTGSTCETATVKDGGAGKSGGTNVATRSCGVPQFSGAETLGPAM